ncbi:hypothetical protein B0H11DRAFT_2248592 [Mycena galericulata]|nr:hypothetical protein B0H11DRAFT_2248592 [Mycena galericulata]
MSQNITYDDRDSIFDYSPGWFRTGTYNATSVGQTGTLASSKITSGVNVTFVFPTPATDFFYFGMKRCCGASYLICIDCDPNHPQYITINAVDPTDNGQNPPVVLFSKSFDVAGVHEVILMNEPDLAFGGNSEITLNRFELTVPDPSSLASIDEYRAWLIIHRSRYNDHRNHPEPFLHLPSLVHWRYAGKLVIFVIQSPGPNSGRRPGWTGSTADHHWDLDPSAAKISSAPI